MRAIIDRKKIQEKLKMIISDYVNMLIETDSKKLKKTIKKASRSVAKAIIKQIEESDGQITLKKTVEVKSTAHPKPAKVTHKKKAAAKPVIKKTKSGPAAKKQAGAPAKKKAVAKPAQRTDLKSAPENLPMPETTPAVATTV